MRSTPFGGIIGGIGALIFATLAKYRLLWFLHDDTILSGGRQVPTAEFAASMSRFFYFGGAFLIVLGFVLALTLSEERRQRVALVPKSPLSQSR